MNLKLTFLGLLFPVCCFSQTEIAVSSTRPVYQDSIPQTAIFLKNRNVIFQKVFTSDLQKEELADRINTLLSKTADFRFDRGCYTSEGEFIGRIIQHKFDVRKYETSMFGTPAALMYPLNASVVVQIKDYKYRVTISEINFKESRKEAKEEPIDVLLDDYITQKNRSKIKAGKSNVKLAGYLNRDFSDMFDLNQSLTASGF